MRYWLTLLMVTGWLAVGYGQAPLTVQWLSFVLNGGTPTPIRLAPDGSLDLTNGVFVDSRFTSISANGRRIVFQVGPKVLVNASGQPQLIPPQIYEMNLMDPTPQARPVQGTFLDANGQPQSVTLTGLHPVISADGQHIAFASVANYGITPNGKQQVYLLDRTQNRIVPVSVLWRDTDGDGMRDTYELSNGNCVPVYVSADGRIVVFLVESPGGLNIVDEDGDGNSDIVSNPPQGWLVLAHDRDADGNGIYDEAGIGATTTRIASYDWQNNQPIIASVGSVHVSANGRFIAYTAPIDPQNPDERWKVVVRDWQRSAPNPSQPTDIGLVTEILNAFAPSLSDDGLYLAYLTPTQTDNDGDGQVNDDPIDGVDNDNDSLVDEDPEETYLQGTMDLVVRRLTDQNELWLSGLQLPPSPGAADGSSGYGYSDWWGAATVAVDPTNPNTVYAALYSWATNLIDLQNNLVRNDDGDGQVDEDPVDGVDNDNDGLTDEDPPLTFYQGTANIFLAGFDFSQSPPVAIRLLPLAPAGQRGLPVSLELVSANPLRYRLPLAPSLIPVASFVVGVDEDPADGVDNDNDGQTDEDPIDGQDNDSDRVLVIVFQSLVPFDNADTNGLWDIYLVRVRLP